MSSGREAVTFGRRPNTLPLSIAEPESKTFETQAENEVVQLKDLRRKAALIFALAGTLIAYHVCQLAAFPQHPQTPGLYSESVRPSGPFVETWIVVLLGALLGAWRGSRTSAHCKGVVTMFKAGALIALLFVYAHILLFVGVLLSEIHFAFPYVPWQNLPHALLEIIPVGLSQLKVDIVFNHEGQIILLSALICGPVLSRLHNGTKDMPSTNSYCAR
jgi:hypothetical protein